MKLIIGTINTTEYIVTYSNNSDNNSDINFDNIDNTMDIENVIYT